MRIYSILMVLALLGFCSCKATQSNQPAAPKPEIRYYVIADT